MSVPLFSTLAAILVSLTALALLISRDWRWDIATLAIQYLGVLILTWVSWPLEMALAKMVAGWMAGAILGIAATNVPRVWVREEHALPSGRLFRLIAAAMVMLIAASAVRRFEGWGFDFPLPVLLGSLNLIGLGLLHLGLSGQPLQVCIGLLTVLSGFEILYAAMENSLLVAGLLASIQLGLALGGAYLILTLDTSQEAE